MLRIIHLSLLATLTTAALAQTTAQPQPSSTTAPVAFVYVGGPTSIEAFAAASTGRLTTVPGSPFADSVSSMSLNKNYLFALGNSWANIYTFSIASNGALKVVNKISAAQNTPSACGIVPPLQIDYSGTSLYGSGACDGTGDNYVESFKIESNGQLQFVGNADSGVPANFPSLSQLVFLGTNQYAYQVGCVIDAVGTENGPVVVRYERGSTGALEAPTILPVPAPATNYCTYVVAGDPTNHLVLGWQDIDSDDDLLGPSVAASYTADAQGNLTTSTPFSQMLEIGGYAASISPSGKLLAFGSDGFDVSHFNGSAPITPYHSGLQAADDFLQFGWDGSNHLYALSLGCASANNCVRQLRVYTATPTSLTEDPGSPITVAPDETSLIVRSN